MIHYPWKPCDVFDLIKSRFNWRPVKVETFANRTYYNASGLSSQNNTYYWRPNEEIFELAGPSSSLEYPLFFGALSVQIGNDDPVSNTVNDAFLIFENQILQNINLAGPFYNLQGGTYQRYGNGAYNGRAFPGPGIVDDYSFYFPKLMLAPFITIQEFTGATGAIFVNANVSFSGFRIDMI